MPVVINEFEVIPERSADRGPGGAQKPTADKGPPLTPHEVVEIIRRQLEREARIRAH